MRTQINVSLHRIAAFRSWSIGTVWVHKENVLKVVCSKSEARCGSDRAHGSFASSLLRNSRRNACCARKPLVTFVESRATPDSQWRPAKFYRARQQVLIRYPIPSTFLSLIVLQVQTIVARLFRTLLHFYRHRVAFVYYVFAIVFPFLLTIFLGTFQWNLFHMECGWVCLTRRVI